MKILFLLCLSLFGVHLVSALFTNTKSVTRKVRDPTASYSSSSSEEGKKPHKRRHYHRRRPYNPRPSGPRYPPQQPQRDPSCPNGWETFYRAQGLWCTKVFYGPATYANSENMCQVHGATLTGVQDSNERMRLAAAARNVINLYGGGEADVWLGATRRPNCPYRSSCAPLDTFQWTDRSATGTAGFSYGTTEPNGVILPNVHSSNQWGQQNCLVLLIHGSSETSRFGYPHGAMDDQHCQNEFKLFACGKRAN